MTQKHKNDTDQIQIEFLELMKEFGPTIHHFISAGSVRGDDPESVEQEFWFKVWNLIKEGKLPEKEEVRPWLYKIAYNMIIDDIRKRRSRDRFEERFALLSGKMMDPDTTAEREQENMAQARNKAFQDALEQLDFKYQRVLKLIYLSGDKLTIKQVAERLGISTSMVKKRRTRAFQLMRAQLKKFSD